MKINYAACLFVVFLAPSTVAAQTFSSGSTGSDGALTYTTPGTYTFDPKAFTPPLDPAGDGIFNFTTITIGAGVTVKLTEAVLNTPVVWLASGTVKIDGTVDLSGQDGFSASNTTQRTNTIPGAGGYAGGYPGVGANPAGAGLGPAGGLAAPNSPCGGFGVPGGFLGNQFLVPLVGGSGGGGSGAYAGGAGGGALLIASSVSISGAGSIKANGGAAVGNSGGGAGGGIRLVASAVTLSGNLNVQGSQGGGCGGASGGVVRVEAFTIGSLSTTGGTLYTATPFGLFVTSTGIPSISVATVGGVAVPTNPTGTFTIPDVTVNSNAPLTFAIKAANVPVGTVATVTIFSENGPDQTIQSTALAGALASSTATAAATLPSGFSKGFVKVTYTQ
jgi:hypothetical protein